MHTSMYFLFMVFVVLRVTNARNPSKGAYEPLQYNKFDEIEEHLFEVDASCGAFTKLESIGKTFEKNDIWMITFSKMLSLRRPIVWVDCGMHARDWITHATCMYIIDSVANHLLKLEINDGIEYLLDNFDLSVIPVVNPDGYIKSWAQYDRGWVKNTSPGTICDGVFLSQNFPFQFGSAYSNRNECDADYIGRTAKSEYETIAIIETIEPLQKSKGIFALFHMVANGQKWLYPWSYTTLSSPASVALQRFCEAAVSAIRKITSKEYECGQTADVDKTRGGTFLDYAHSDIGIFTIYSIALRAGDGASTYEVPEDEIEDSGEEILGGILAAVTTKSKELDCLKQSDYSAVKYNRFNQIVDHLRCINRTLEGKVELESIGKTFENNDIWEVTFSKDFTKNRDIVWIDCGMQGRDWLTHSTCMYIIDVIARHFIDEIDPMVDGLLDRFDLVVIPVVNPDGYIKSWTSYNRHWTKNANVDGGVCTGVYVGQNFPYMFDFPYSNQDECDLDYVGPWPVSELETKALKSSLLDLQQKISTVFHLEFSGQNWTYPWSYSGKPSQFYDCLERNCQSGVSAILGETGRQYSCHQMSHGNGGQRGGTFIDYLHNDIDIRLVYSLALRSGSEVGYDVSPDQIADTGREIWRGILAAVDKSVIEPCTIIPTKQPPPTTPGPPEGK